MQFCKSCCSTNILKYFAFLCPV